LDLDLAVRDKGVRGSNQARRSRIERPREKGTEGRRRCDAGGNTRGGAARGSPELGVPAAPGVKLTWAWVRRDLRDTRDSPRALKKRREDSSGEFDGGGGSGRRRIGGARVLGVTGG
jgi:hypothetical protein